jgi:hypothetical protein
VQPPVIPAKAGIHFWGCPNREQRIPAFAGMTEKKIASVMAPGYSAFISRSHFFV